VTALLTLEERLVEIPGAALGVVVLQGAPELGSREKDVSGFCSLGIRSFEVDDFTDLSLGGEDIDPSKGR